MSENNDPVVASYNVVLTKSSAVATDSRCLILQYPSHRPSSRPYSAARAQKPERLRMKPGTGVLEVEVPILKQENYNQDAGERYGKALADSHMIQVGGSHGLGGGFANNTAQYNIASLQDFQAHDNMSQQHGQLRTQTIGGKIAKPTERDPLYFLASIDNTTLNLSYLDSVVQLRPQLHHLDAEDENNQKRFQMASASGPGRAKSGFESQTPKIESKAIEIKMKDTKDDARDRGLNEGARLLRDIQADTWISHEWIDQDDETARNTRSAMVGSPHNEGASQPRLKSVLGNGDWLDRMSAPREDGKKGLLAKLRGRERERARRKKAEEDKKLKPKPTTASAVPNSGTILEQSSESDLSSPEASDPEAGETAAHAITINDIDDVEIKEEGEGPAADAGPSNTMPMAATAVADIAPTPRRKGRLPM